MSEAGPGPVTGPLFPREPSMRVELDKKALFALASDTRLEILKALSPMRRTVTQLSQSIGIDKAAIHRHLKKLEEGEFVRRYEDHGFIYYGLTWKARDLLDPKENTRIIILISSAWAFLLGAVILIAFSFAYAPGDAEFNKGAGDDGLTVSIDTTVLILGAIALLGVGLFLAGRSMRYLRKPVQPPSAEESG